MSKALLIGIDAVQQHLVKLFKKHCLDWLIGNGKWPLPINLGVPDQKSALQHKQALPDWLTQWRNWRSAGTVVWCTRKWPVLGEQTLPEKILFADPQEVIIACQQQKLWKQLNQRASRLLQHWPQLQSHLAKCQDVLINYTDDNFENLLTVITWFVQNPAANIYLRQLPIPGIHSKWIESRKKVIISLLKAITFYEHHDFYKLTGLKREPVLIRMRILDPLLRNCLGGLSDISATADEIAQLNFPVKHIYIVENLRTGLAFNDIPRAVLFIGLGYSVNLLSTIPWLQYCDCFYWGDIDTQGFAILNRARAFIPHLQSILMDQETLFKAKPLWVEESEPCRAEDLCYLTSAEKALYLNLKNNVWGYHIRLEQERILWQDAWSSIEHI